MADTRRGDFAGKSCTDCGKQEVAFKHWGPLVPAGEVGYFCFEDFEARQKYFNEHGKPKPFPLANEAAIPDPPAEPIEAPPRYM